MKKNTMYLVGGLAVLGLGYYFWNKKRVTTENENETSEDYSNATGKLVRCKRPDGSYYSTNYKCINYAVEV